MIASVSRMSLFEHSQHFEYTQFSPPRTCFSIPQGFMTYSHLPWGASSQRKKNWKINCQTPIFILIRVMILLLYFLLDVRVPSWYLRSLLVCWRSRRGLWQSRWHICRCRRADVTNTSHTSQPQRTSSSCAFQADLYCPSLPLILIWKAYQRIRLSF